MENKILLIGGPARCGKSTLAAMVRKEIDGQIISGDALSRGLRGVVGAEELPDLFVDQIDKFLLTDPHNVCIDRLRRRDRTMWRFYKGYIREAHRISKDDILLDANLWPDFLPELELGHRAVFMVDTSDNRAEWVRNIRDNVGDRENNWMRDRNYSDEKIELWAKFDVARSRKMIELCEENDYPYFDLAVHGIARAQELAKEYLLGNG